MENLIKAYDYQYDALPIHAESGKREWINNKACCTSRGFAIDESIMVSASYYLDWFNLRAMLTLRYNKTHTI